MKVWEWVNPRGEEEVAFQMRVRRGLKLTCIFLILLAFVLLTARTGGMAQSMQKAPVPARTTGIGGADGLSNMAIAGIVAGVVAVVPVVAAVSDDNDAP